MGADAKGPPRILMVGRRLIRKSKYVNFVGDFHLNLVLEMGAVPVILPRSKGILRHLEQFEPIHGLLLVEGEDVLPKTYGKDYSDVTAEEYEKIKAKFAGDTEVDPFKDELEMALIRICLARGLPILSICRGSQLVNVASGGDLYIDIETQLGSSVIHYDRDNYDGHRHPIFIDESTPMYGWFGGSDTMMVSSYHHCGIKKLAPRFRPMAIAPDGLVEAFYDPEWYDPEQGRLIVGLQFHPERMQCLQSHLADAEPVFEHVGCKAPYEAFINAAAAHVVSAKPKVVKPRRVSALPTLPLQTAHKPSPWRAHFTVHGGTMALSLLQDGVDPFAQVDTQFLVPEDDVSIGDGQLIVDLPDPLELDVSELSRTASDLDVALKSQPMAV